MSSILSRRTFAKSVSAGALLSWLDRNHSINRNEELVKSITNQPLWSNPKGRNQTWFHPKVCMIPAENGNPTALMTLQTIKGSDYFGPVHWSVSRDLGLNWSEPVAVASLGRKPVTGHRGLEQGVCDVVPQYHAPTRTVLAVGHVVFYRGPKFSKNDQLARFPVYAIRRQDGTWSPSKKLEWNDPRGSFIYSNNCGQRVVLPNGDIQLAFTFGPKSEHRSVAGVRCSFDGETMRVIQVGQPIELKHKRGLLEPSITRYDDRFFITIRAEDNRGYVCESRDGLNWSPKKAWSWDDGSMLTMSTTQQHWLTHQDGLFLVYTRKDKSNANVIRWRAPLFMAKVDTKRLCLVRESERVVQPMLGDGVNDPDNVPLMGNFDVTNAAPDQSWVTVGSWLPRKNSAGTVQLARIHWNKPNRNVVEKL